MVDAPPVLDGGGVSLTELCDVGDSLVDVLDDEDEGGGVFDSVSLGGALFSEVAGGLSSCFCCWLVPGFPWLKTPDPTSPCKASSAPTATAIAMAVATTLVPMISGQRSFLSLSANDSEGSSGCV